jgi:putative copper export protein
MTFVETLLFLAKWLHGIAAVTWIGGCIFYFIVLTPLLSKGAINGDLSRSIARGFGNIVRLCIGVIVITGSVIMLNTLTSSHMNSQYVVTLSFKVVLSITMFYLVWRQGRRLMFREHDYDQKSLDESHLTIPPSFRPASRIPKIILALGIITFLLSDLLAIIFLKSVGDH